MTQKELPAYYPLTAEVSQLLRGANLTAAEWRFWAYMTEVDSWGDGYRKFSPLTVCAECGMSKPTYYRTKAKFQELGLFDFQEEGASVRNLKGISSLKQSKDQKSSLKNDTGSLKNDTGNLKNETKKSKMRLDSQKFNNESPEPAPCKGSEIPQTLKTYSDLQDSLTQKTRESFEKFCFRKIEESSFKIASPKSWLNKHYLEYWEEFCRKHPEAAGVEKSSATAEPDEFMTAEYLQRIYGADWKEAAEHFGIEHQE